MTATELVKLVAEMRELQKQYFIGRASDVLLECKAKEREVDRAVKDWNGGQKSLLNRDEK